jgi:hypothetical protein
MRPAFLVIAISLLLSAAPLRAEFLQIDLSIFGMD